MGRAESKRTSIVGQAINRLNLPRRLLDRIQGALLYEGGEVSEGFRTKLTRVRVEQHVTEIPEYTFSGCTKLSEVQLNEGLQSIGEYAFQGCTALKRIIIPSSVTRLDYGAFYGCNSLAELQFNEGLEFIGESAFSSCMLIRIVTLPSTVTELGENSFYGCHGLAEVQFNDELQIIGEGAFELCTALQCVTIPPTVTELGRNAFSHCSNLSEVIFLGGERLLDRELLDPCPYGILNQRKINEMIGQNAFYDSPLAAVKISISWAICERMEKLPPECRVSVVERIRDLPCLELTQDGNVFACFPVVTRAVDNECVIQDTNLVTARSLCQALKLIVFHELKEAIILFELAMWKSRIDGEAAESRVDCRVPIPDPAKNSIMEFCGFSGLLEPTIENSYWA